MADARISDLPAAVFADLTSTDIMEMSDLDAAPALQSKKVTLALLRQFVRGIAIPPKSITAADSPYLVLDTDETILVSTTAGAVQVTLPVAPATGRTVIIKRVTTDANVLTIARNAKKIEGAAANLTASGALSAFTLQYSGLAGAFADWWLL